MLVMLLKVASYVVKKVILLRVLKRRLLKIAIKVVSIDVSNI